MKKENIGKMLHNQRFIEILYKIGYNLEDSFECYDFLMEDLKTEGEANFGTIVHLKPRKSWSSLSKASEFTTENK